MMTNKEKITSIVNSHGYITSEQAKNHSIPSWFLSNMVKKDKLRRVDRGVYIPNNGIYDEYFIFQYRHKKAIFSYTNALYFHDLTDYIPTKLDVTVYQGYNTHRFDNNVRIHYVKKHIYSLGVTTIDSPYGNPIRVYNKERCLCDLVISKQVTSSDIFKDAFKNYFKRNDININTLMQYASTMGIETEMYTLIEVLS